MSGSQPRPDQSTRVRRWRRGVVTASLTASLGVATLIGVGIEHSGDAGTSIVSSTTSSDSGSTNSDSSSTSTGSSSGSSSSSDRGSSSSGGLSAGSGSDTHGTTGAS